MMEQSTVARYQAALGALACFVFPENDAQRGYTVLACANVGVDYIEHLADELGTETDFDHARRGVARTLLAQADAHRAAQRTPLPRRRTQ